MEPMGKGTLPEFLRNHFAVHTHLKLPSSVLASRITHSSFVDSSVFCLTLSLIAWQPLKPRLQQLQDLALVTVFLD